MKVCKVVFNSVSHDARVLKEAMSVSELGHDVTIVGIQDANNSSPSEQYENVRIKRSAWKSEALKPITGLYLITLAFMIVVGVFVTLVGFYVIDNFEFIYRLILNYLTFPVLLLSIVVIFTLRLMIKLGVNYKKRRATYSVLKSEERNQVLRLGNENSDIARVHGNIEADKVRAGGQVSHTSFVQRHYPRPIMAGILKIFDQKSRRTWKTVFARENTIYRILCDEQPSIIHAHDVSALPVCAKYKRKFGCKLVFDAHEMYDHLAQSEAGMSNINKKTMLKYSDDVDLFVTINDSIANYYKQNYPGFPKAIVVKNATHLADEIEYDGRLHEAAGLPRERKILLYQGGFANKRGLIQLLMSAEYLDPSWTIVFMGWGSLRNDMKRVSDALIMKTPELSERIKFVPKVKQKDLAYWTSGATLGVIPYENTSLNHWFCTPNKLWEYPNAGVPIIASPFPEMQKVIVQNSIGWFLPDPLTPEKIAEAINALDDNELLQTRKNCRKFISQDNWSKYAQRLQESYGELS